MLGDSRPENVVLLEIDPAKQKTRVDFACTESLLGIPPVSLTDITKRGRQLFYQHAGREVRIERIYNRVIFDELLRRPDLKLPFSFQEELDVFGLVIQTGISGSANIRCHFSRPHIPRGHFLPTNFRLPNRPAISS